MRGNPLNRRRLRSLAAGGGAFSRPNLEKTGRRRESNEHEGLPLTLAIARTAQSFVLHTGLENGFRSADSPAGAILVFRTPASDKSLNSINAAASTFPIRLVDVVILLEGLFTYIAELGFKPIHFFLPFRRGTRPLKTDPTIKRNDHMG